MFLYFSQIGVSVHFHPGHHHPLVVNVCVQQHTVCRVLKPWMMLWWCVLSLWACVCVCVCGACVFVRLQLLQPNPQNRKHAILFKWNMIEFACRTGSDWAPLSCHQMHHDTNWTEVDIIQIFKLFYCYLYIFVRTILYIIQVWTVLWTNLNILKTCIHHIYRWLLIIRVASQTTYFNAHV